MTAGKRLCFCIFVTVNRLPLVFFGILLFGAVQAQTVSDTIRYLSYNSLKFDYTGGGKEVHFRTVLSAYKPDLFVMQELMDASGADRFRDSVAELVNPDYAMAEFVEGYDTDNGMFYDATQFTCVSNTPIITELRNISQFHMQHLASGTHFYVYVVHLKASSGGENEAQRKREVDSLRAYTALLPENAFYWVSGDFNMYDENEDGYLALMDDAEPGYFVDILADSLSTTWNNAANARFHTQSTRLDAFGGGSTGGMDDRFDMILCSPSILTGDSLYIIPETMKPIGNDGMRYNQTINDPVNAAVSEELADALYFASDHIPITASFVFQYETPEDTTQDTTLIIADAHLSPLNLYPNPATSYIIVDAPFIPDGWVITDMAGHTCAQSLQSPSASTFRLTLPDYLPAGCYSLQCLNNKRIAYATFIKK